MLIKLECVGRLRPYSIRHYLGPYFMQDTLGLFDKLASSGIYFLFPLISEHSHLVS
jgi:hypothetical protein